MIGQGRGRPVPKKPSIERLSRVAMHYLERYASSSSNLKRVLDRRIKRYERAAGETLDAAAMIDEVVRRCVSSGLVDDRRYAEQVAGAQRRRGGSRSSISARLRAKGVTPEAAAEALAGLETTDEEACRRLAQRLRLGPWRARNRQERRDRDVAALCRHGFPPSLARAVVDGELETPST